jgi:hypothetical protein
MHYESRAFETQSTSLLIHVALDWNQKNTKPQEKQNFKTNSTFRREHFEAQTQSEEVCKEQNFESSYQHLPPIDILT